MSGKPLLLDDAAYVKRENLDRLERFLRWVAFLAVLVVAAGLGVVIAWVLNAI